MPGTEPSTFCVQSTELQPQEDRPKDQEINGERKSGAEEFW